MKFRFRYICSALALLLLVFASVHRIVFEVCPDAFCGHWSEAPTAFLLLAIFLTLPIQLILSLASMPKHRRAELLPNGLTLIGTTLSAMASFLFIDPMFMLYST